MKKLLAPVLAVSLLLNAALLLQRRREAPPPTVVRTQVVERTLPAPPALPAASGPPPAAPAESVPRVIPTAPSPAPATAPSVMLVATPTFVTVDGEITVTLTVLSGTPAAREWIGLFAVGADVTRYVSYQYVTDARSYAFRPPKGPGDYEFRYGLADDRTTVASSNSFRMLDDPRPKPQVQLENGVATVSPGGEIPVRWNVYSGRRTKRDWIGLYAPGAKNEDFLTWKYVEDADASTPLGTSRGGLVLKAPEQPGTYEMRYLLDDGFEAVAISVRVVVVP